MTRTLRISSTYRPGNPPLCGNLDCLCPLEYPIHATEFRAERWGKVYVTETPLCIFCMDAFGDGKEFALKVE